MGTITDPALFATDAFVEIQKKGSSSRFDATVDVDSFDEAGFEREVESRTFFNNAKVVIKTTQNDGQVTVNAKLRSADWHAILHGGEVNADGTGSMLSGGTQDDYRIIFLVTEDPSVTAASDAVGSGYLAYRVIYAGANATNFTPGLEADGLLEGEMEFNVSPLDSFSDPNIRVDVVNEGLGSVANYTTSFKYPAL